MEFHVAVKCVDMEEHRWQAALWSVTDAEARKRGEQAGLKDTLVVLRRKR